MRYLFDSQISRLKILEFREETQAVYVFLDVISVYVTVKIASLVQMAKDKRVDKEENYSGIEPFFYVGIIIT